MLGNLQSKTPKAAAKAKQKTHTETPKPALGTPGGNKITVCPSPREGQLNEKGGKATSTQHKGKPQNRYFHEQKAKIRFIQRKPEGPLAFGCRSGEMDMAKGAPIQQISSCRHSFTGRGKTTIKNKGPATGSHSERGRATIDEYKMRLVRRLARPGEKRGTCLNL